MPTLFVCLLDCSGDGRLSAYDLRKNVLVGKSDELDDELLSVTVIKVRIIFCSLL